MKNSPASFYLFSGMNPNCNQIQSNKQIAKFLIIIVIMLGVHPIFAQRSHIPLSETKETIQGKTFYMHTVEKGQTLYSIAAAYNVTTSEIAEFNENVFEGIEIDEIVKIPVIKGKNASLEEILYAKEFQFHYVLKGETLYSIISKYKSSETALKKWNPGLEAGLKTGMVLRVPRSGADLREAEEELLQPAKPAPVVEADAHHFIHTVVKGETLYSLSRMYKIPLQQLIDSNPGTSDGLSIGEKLRIPNKYKSSESVAQTTRPAVERSKGKPCKLNANMNPRDTIQLALLLPFYLTENEKLARREPNVEEESGLIQTEQDKPVVSNVYNKSKVFLEFYEGFLIGLDEARKQQIPVHLSVFDTNGRLDSLIRIIRNPVLQKMDLVIGPAYDATIREFNNFSKEYEVPFIPPLLSVPDGMLGNNPDLIQVIPSVEDQVKAFSEVIAMYHTYNIVLIHYNTDQEKEVVDMFSRYLNPALKAKSGNESAKFKIDIHNRTKAYEIDKLENEAQQEVFVHPLKRALSTTKPNLVILPSRDQGIVSNTIRELNMIANEKSGNYEITLCGFQQARGFENIDMEAFYNLRFHTFTGFYVDYTRPLVKDFVLKYRELYKDEPSQFAFQGYDIAMYFIQAYKSYGKNFQDCLTRDVPSFTSSCLQNEFIFKRKEDDSGIENVQATVLRYNADYTISRIDASQVQMKTDEPKKGGNQPPSN